MRTVITSRYALSIGVIAALLAGCGGRSQLPIATPQGVKQPLSSPLSGVVNDVGEYSIIHAFRGPDGNWPETLTRRNGNIFGETLIGGSKTCDCGVVFKLSPSGSHYEFTVLHVFTGGSNDGSGPSSLIAASSGALYGSTGQGGGTGCSYSGSVGCGIVFKLTPSGSGYAYSILYRFKNRAGGYGPGLVSGQSLPDGGQILGIAGGGARKNCSCGILFELVRSGNQYTKRVLWNFGANVGGGGAMVIDGKIYGTIYGTRGSYAYRFDSGRMTVLHKFRQSDAKNGTDAALSVSDPAGNLYGSAGGGSDRCVIGKLHHSCGLIYELVAAGGKYAERVLHRFSPGLDGCCSPGVEVYQNGTLYGTTGWGGNKCDKRSDGCGVIFAISTSTGKETVLYRFSGGARGAFPSPTLVKAPSENALYGATSYGDYQNAGAVFRLAY
ncbi:MAG: choice-of-anchor tandem repeat GloVer-containing protein [Candidatus Cybelea sp.]